MPRLIHDILSVRTVVTENGFTVSGSVEHPEPHNAFVRYGFMVDFKTEPKACADLLASLGHVHQSQFGNQYYVPCGQCVEDVERVLNEEVEIENGSDRYEI